MSKLNLDELQRLDAAANWSDDTCPNARAVRNAMPAMIAKLRAADALRDAVAAYSGSVGDWPATPGERSIDAALAAYDALAGSLTRFDSAKWLEVLK